MKLPAWLRRRAGLDERQILRRQSLAETIDRIARGDRQAPVLDWTRLDLLAALPGRNVFAPPPGANGRLPYLDRTVSVVVVDDRARVEEARRVAERAVVIVRAGKAGSVEARTVERLHADPEAESVVLVVVGSHRRDRWLGRVRQAVAGEPRVEVVLAAEAAPGAGVVVLAERGVLPLPGCIEALCATLRSSERVGGVTAKLHAADGSLAAAGATVFSDGSVARIAAGCHDATAPWHEYVRPVCAASGLLALRPGLATETGLVAASAAVWDAGCKLLYQPDARAVRALEATGHDEGHERWARALPARPGRPQTLDDGAWRELLVRDDVEDAWR
jgi:hypothetical protein